MLCYVSLWLSILGCIGIEKYRTVVIGAHTCTSASELTLNERARTKKAQNFESVNAGHSFYRRRPMSVGPHLILVEEFVMRIKLRCGFREMTLIEFYTDDGISTNE